MAYMAGFFLEKNGKRGCHVDPGLCITAGGNLTCITLYIHDFYDIWFTRFTMWDAEPRKTSNDADLSLEPRTSYGRQWEPSNVKTVILTTWHILRNQEDRQGKKWRQKKMFVRRRGEKKEKATCSPVETVSKARREVEKESCETRSRSHSTLFHSLRSFPGWKKRKFEMPPPSIGKESRFSKSRTSSWLIQDRNQNLSSSILLISRLRAVTFVVTVRLSDSSVKKDPSLLRSWNPKNSMPWLYGGKFVRLPFVWKGGNDFWSHLLCIREDGGKCLRFHKLKIKYIYPLHHFTPSSTYSHANIFIQLLLQPKTVNPLPGISSSSIRRGEDRLTDLLDSHLFLSSSRLIKFQLLFHPSLFYSSSWHTNTTRRRRRERERLLWQTFWSYQRSWCCDTDDDNDGKKDRRKSEREDCLSQKGGEGTGENSGPHVCDVESREKDS